MAGRSDHGTPFPAVILFGNGSANAAHFNATHVPYANGALIGAGHWIRAADLDGDLFAEIAIAHFDHAAMFWNGLIVMRNINGKLFTPMLNLTIPICYSVEFGDFDNNGLLDILVGGSALHGQLISLNAGSGNMLPFVRVGESSSVEGTLQGTVVDYNLDGWLDVVVISEALASNAAGGVHVALNDGAGRFITNWRRLDVNFDRPFFVLAEDLSGDSVPELVVGDYNLAKILIMQGSCEAKVAKQPYEHGRLTPASYAPSYMPTALLPLPAPGAVRHDLVVASLDGLAIYSKADWNEPAYVLPGVLAVTAGDLGAADGRVDLVLARANGALHVALNSGSGSTSSFSASLSTPFATGLDAIVFLDLARLNADTVLDLLVATRAASGLVSIRIAVGRPDSSFTPLQLVATNATFALTCLAVADISGDGRADIAVGGERFLGVYLNNGAAGFPSAPLPVAYFANRTVHAIALGELDQFSVAAPRLDLAVACSDGVHTIVNRDNGLFAATVNSGSPQAVLNPFLYASNIRIGDLDANGMADLVVAGAHWVGVYRNGPYAAGLSWMTLELIYAEPSASVVPLSGLALGDWDGDGVLDAASAIGTNVWAHRTALRSSPADDAPFEARCEGPALGSLTNMRSPTGAGHVTDLLAVGRGPLVISTHADFAFATRTNVSMLARNWRDLSSPVLFDRYANGVMDLAMIAGANKTVIWLLGNGASFAENAAISTVHAFGASGVTPLALAAGDGNRDNRDDLLIGTSNSLVLAQAGVNFTLTTLLNASGPIEAVAFVDMNADGVLDAVAACSAAVLLISPPSGSASLGLSGAVSVTTLIELGAGSFAVADVTGDGFADIIIGRAPGGSASGALVILIASGSMETTKLVVATALPGLPSPGVPGSAGIVVRAGDMDGDDDIDLIFALVSKSASGVWTLLNRGGADFQPVATISSVTNVTSIALSDADTNGRMDVVVGRASNVAPLNVLLSTGPTFAFGRHELIGASVSGLTGDLGSVLRFADMGM